MTNPFRKFESPSGIDLYPAPPSAVRISKRAGVLALVLVCAVVALIGYGVVTRRQRSVSMVELDSTKSLTAATEVGKSIASEVPAKSLAGAVAADAEEPEESDADEDWEQEQPQYPSRPWQQPVQPQMIASPPPPPARPALTPEQRRRLTAYQLEQQAKGAPTGSGSGLANPTANASENSVGPAGGGSLTDLVRGMMARNQSIPATGEGVRQLAGGFASESLDAEADPESGLIQSAREQFLERARQQREPDVLPAVRTPPISEYEIEAGWDIPAVLEHGLNSDLPGEVKALVRENVYDTATGQHLLIPQGSRLVGIYDSRIAYGQDGMMVVWNRIIFPDGSSMRLEGMASQDSSGQSGLRHRVDNHYRRLLGFAALTSVFSAAFQLSQSPRGGILAYPSAGEMAGTAIGRELSQFGAQVTRRNLNVQPTIRIPVGYRFNVRVNQDLVFLKPEQVDSQRR